MHFNYLLVVNLPKITPEPEWEKEVDKEIARLETKYVASLDEPYECAELRLRIEETNAIRTAFGRELMPIADEALEQFCTETDNKKYLKFYDRTEEFLDEYEKHVRTCKFPDECMSFDAFVKEYFGAVKNEETGVYGGWYNPNGVFDWYTIGGRWPAIFLVKTDCKEYSVGSYWAPDGKPIPAPEGYMWVCCARKKDIEWTAMRQWYHRVAVEQSVLSEKWKYPVDVYGLFYGKKDLLEEEYHIGELNSDEVYHQIIDEFIDLADDDDVFVGVDCHC